MWPITFKHWEKQNLLFPLFNYPVFATKQFCPVQKIHWYPWKLFGSRQKCSVGFVHFSRVWPQSKTPSEYISLNGTKLFWVLHAMNGLLKRWPTFHVTVGLKQNTRNSVTGLKRLKFHRYFRRRAKPIIIIKIKETLWIITEASF